MPKSKKKALPHITPEILAVVNEVFEVNLVSDRGDLFARDYQTSESMYLERRTTKKFYEITLKIDGGACVIFDLPYLEEEDPEFFRGRLLSAHYKACAEQVNDLLNRVKALVEHSKSTLLKTHPEVDTQQENP